MLVSCPSHRDNLTFDIHSSIPLKDLTPLLDPARLSLPALSSSSLKYRQTLFTGLQLQWHGLIPLCQQRLVMSLHTAYPPVANCSSGWHSWACRSTDTLPMIESVTATLYIGALKVLVLRLSRSTAVADMPP